MSVLTPGSWTWDGKFTVTIPNADGSFYAFRTDPDAARLIAAAPDLLDALRRAERVLTDAGADHEPTDDDARLALDSVRAVIAKVEGQ